MAIDALKLLEDEVNMLTQLGELSAALDENKKLAAALATAKAELQRVTDHLSARERELKVVHEKVDDLEGDRAAVDHDIVDAVDAFLDEVERPVGTRDFNVPKTPAVTRALIGLHDAISRSL